MIIEYCYRNQNMQIDDYRIQTNSITPNLTLLEPLLMVHKSVNIKATFNNRVRKLFVSINNDINEYSSSDIFQAIDKLNSLMVSFASTFQPDEFDNCNENQNNKPKQRGGKREGAGRPVTNPTKPVRLNEFEQRLISEFRLMNGDTKQNLKRIVKYMAVLELGDENKSD